MKHLREYKEKLNDNFWKWFGNSKVVDENGKPLIVFHGSPSVFSVFKPSKSVGTHGEDDQLEGMYFTDNEDGARFFTESDHEKYFKRVYLSLQNPYTAHSINELKETLKLEKLGDVSAKVKSMGYDGLIIERGFYAMGGPYRKFIAFYPNQIKSATSNNGDFNPNSEDINENKILNMKHLKERSEYTYYNDELNPKVWIDGVLDEKLRKKLLTIANDFFQDTKLGLEIKDITLTGSLCNYNYNQFSDFDIHIIVDYTSVDGDSKIVQAAIDSYRVSWNLKHDIRIRGYEVEIYIQDSNDDVRAESGLYSLKDDKWLKKPVHNTPEIDEEEIEFKFANYKSGINRLVELSQMEMTPELARKYSKTSYDLKKKIHGQRKIDLQTDKAEFSVGNLVFKRLRNSGHFKALIDVINTFYDKIYAQ